MNSETLLSPIFQRFAFFFTAAILRRLPATAPARPLRLNLGEVMQRSLPQVLSLLSASQTAMGKAVHNTTMKQSIQDVNSCKTL